MDLKKASDKDPQDKLWVCGGHVGNQGLALSHPVLEYSHTRLLNNSLPTQTKESCAIVNDGKTESEIGRCLDAVPAVM